MKLSGRAQFGFSGEPILILLEEAAGTCAFWGRNISRADRDRIRVAVGKAGEAEVILPSDFGYLSRGDILRLNPHSREVRVVYRRNSRHNFLFLTERCNSRCIMCSQPPRDVNDGYLADEALAMLPWMAKETPELGITGGEPTLLGRKLVDVIAAAKEMLPQTSLHMLSNGRLFAYAQNAEAIGSIAHPDFMVGVPLYAEIARVHDFVVQAAGAFEQTIFGLLNLARAGVRIELRMVIHRETYARLPNFARYVARNLPFVDQVALMGLEPTGFTKTNLRALWIDPLDYEQQLAECIERLTDAAIPALIFNHPLCALRPALHKYARKSISDWKNIYLPECDSCQIKAECAGFFLSARGVGKTYVED